MSRFNTLLHGDLTEVMSILGEDRPKPLEAMDLRAILSNLCEKVTRLDLRQDRAQRQNEGEVERLEARLTKLEEDR